MTAAHRSTGFWLVTLSLMTGCEGLIGDPATAVGGPVPKIDATNPEPPPAQPPSSADAPIARLTDLELRNTLQDLYGPEAAELVNSASTFAGASLADISTVEGVGRFQLAEAVAELVHQRPTVMTCGGTERDACTQQILQEQAPRILRRPLSDSQLHRYVAAAAEEPSFEDGIYLVLAALLTSPDFLYRIERGDQDAPQNGFLPLTDHEMAARLSYALWRSMPDETLLAAARNGQLSSREAIHSEVLRMLDDPRARHVVQDFHRWWLHLDESIQLNREAASYPDYEADDPKYWVTETERFAEHVVFDSEGSLVELFSAAYSLLEDRSAKSYGVTPGPVGRPTALPQEERAGLLTQPAVTGIHAPEDRIASIYRGAFVFREVLCGELDTPPGDIPGLPEADPNSSLREQIEVLTTSNEPCRSCHVQFNPFGFALSRFDAVGAVATQDVNGKEIEDAVTLLGPGDLEGVEVHGPVELANEIANSAALRDCYTDRWFRYLSGRDFDVAAGDAYSRGLTQYEFEVAGRSVRELLASMLSSDAFRYIPVRDAP